MKKLLLLSSALMAISAASTTSALEVKVSGKVQFTANFGDDLKDVGGTNATGALTAPPYSDDVRQSAKNWDTDADVTFTAESTACCLGYGVRVNLDIDPDAGTVSDTDAKLWIGTQYGKFEFGEVDASQAAFDQSFMDVGPLHGGKDITVPFVSTAALMSDNDHKFDSEIPTTGIAFIAPVGPFTVAASTDANSNTVASIKGSYYLMGYDVAGVAAFAGDTYAAQLSTTVSGVKVGGTIGEDGDDEEFYGGGLGYTMDAWSFSATAMRADAYARFNTGPVVYKAKETDLTLGVDYKLAPGLVVDGSIQSSKRVTTASAAAPTAVSNNRWTKMAVRIAATF